MFKRRNYCHIDSVNYQPSNDMITLPSSDKVEFEYEKNHIITIRVIVFVEAREFSIFCRSTPEFGIENRINSCHMNTYLKAGLLIIPLSSAEVVCITAFY